MVASPLQGLKGFAASQPPLLVFTICILAFGVTTIMLALIVRGSDLPNPDIDMDWNVFLNHLSELDMCVDINNATKFKEKYNKKTVLLQSNLNLALSNSTNSSLTPSETPLEEKSLSELLDDISQLQSSSDKGPHVNLTKHVLVPLKFGPDLLNIPSSVKWLKGSVSGRQLGRLYGKSSKQSLSMSVFIPSHNRRAFAEKCKLNKEDCQIQLNVCLLFFGPSNLFPKTREPQKCSMGKLGNSRKPVNFVFHKSGTKKYCTEKTPLKMGYSARPDYTVMLSPSERSIVNLHLMHTSYFLFVIVVTMLCYALVRSHFRSAKTLVTSEKVNV